MRGRFCRTCGMPVALEDHEDDPTRPFVCRACLGDLEGAPWFPYWAENVRERLAAAGL